MQGVTYNTLLSIFLTGLAFNTAAYAGSGVYLGADVVRHTLDVSTVTYYSSTLPTSFADTEDAFVDAGIRAGYKYKSRLTDRYFWAPELAVTSFDGNDLLYSTSLRLGYELAPYEMYATLGVSRVDKFTDNRLNYGIGLEYRLTNNSSLNLEWVLLDTISESTSSSDVIGLDTVDIRTETARDINTLKIGFTYYFQGSI